MPNEKIIAFEPSPKKEDFINAAFSGKYDTLIFGGGMGGGKSYVSTAVLLLLCRIYPGSKWVIVRESLPSLKRTIIPTFEKICPKPFISKFNRSEQVVTFTNGSQVHFM